MAESKADLILHPLRIQIIQALAGSQLSAQELAERLQDVPPATLYRHINKLAGAGVLTVVERRPVRGTVEKVYALGSQTVLRAEDMASATRDDHMRYFMTFLAGLAGDFGRYLAQEEFDLQADGVGYRTAPFYLSDAELMDLIRKLQAVLLEAAANGPGPGRRRRMLSTVLIADPKES